MISIYLYKVHYSSLSKEFKLFSLALNYQIRISYSVPAVTFWPPAERSAGCDEIQRFFSLKFRLNFVKSHHFPTAF